MQDQIWNHDQEGDRKELHITESGQKIQWCKFKNESWIKTSFEEEDENEFHKQIDGEEDKETIWEEP